MVIVQTTFVTLGIMLAVILIWFAVIRRPIYEAIFVSFVVLVTINGRWGKVWDYFTTTLNTSTLYSMTAFVLMSILLTKTGVIDGAIGIILALLGRVTGGAGYVAVAVSGFMGALSGSGPGNVMATGTITIPAMKKSGFPSELAANIESASSCLGNMIPPSSTIVVACGLFQELHPELNLSIGQFWMVCWGCSIWFILLRFLMVFIFCKIYKVAPVPKEDIPKLRDVFREGWRGLLLPVIIFIPFLLDYLFKSTFFTARLGETGAKHMSSSILFFVAGVVAIYTMFIVRDKKMVSPRAIAGYFSAGVKSIVPTIAVCFFGYMLGALFNDLDIGPGLQAGIASLSLGKLGLCVVIPLITAVLGIAIVGSSMVVLFGSVIIALFTAVGVNPLLVAAMLPCICAVMSNMVPPIAPAFLAGVSLANADFGKAAKNDIWWIVTQYILEVIVLMGFLPVFGL